MSNAECGNEGGAPLPICASAGDPVIIIIDEPDGFDPTPEEARRVGEILDSVRARQREMGKRPNVETSK